MIDTTPHDPPPLAVDATKAARLCGIGRTTFLGLVNSGRAPPPLRLGRRCVWLVSELTTWLAAGAPTLDQLERLKK
jgi:predicted DNA-binding transcriptional regulator AlpA